MKKWKVRLEYHAICAEIVEAETEDEARYLAMDEANIIGAMELYDYTVSPVKGESHD